MLFFPIICQITKIDQKMTKSLFPCLYETLVSFERKCPLSQQPPIVSGYFCLSFAQKVENRNYVDMNSILKVKVA